MTPSDIISTVKRLDPDNPSTWIAVVHLVAEHCAQLADEAPPG